MAADTRKKSVTDVPGISQNDASSMTVRLLLVDDNDDDDDDADASYVMQEWNE
jgi:hypothetical protein